LTDGELRPFSSELVSPENVPKPALERELQAVVLPGRARDGREFRTKRTLAQSLARVRHVENLADARYLHADVLERLVQPFVRPARAE
jgi:hypothetical protein